MTAATQFIGLKSQPRSSDIADEAGLLVNNGNESLENKIFFWQSTTDGKITYLSDTIEGMLDNVILGHSKWSDIIISLSNYDLSKLPHFFFTDDRGKRIKEWLEQLDINSFLPVSPCWLIPAKIEKLPLQNISNDIICYQGYGVVYVNRVIYAPKDFDNEYDRVSGYDRAAKTDFHHIMIDRKHNNKAQSAASVDDSIARAIDSDTVDCQDNAKPTPRSRLDKDKLSLNEQQAFIQIARALGVRYEGESEFNDIDNNKITNAEPANDDYNPDSAETSNTRTQTVRDNFRASWSDKADKKIIDWRRLFINMPLKAMVANGDGLIVEINRLCADYLGNSVKNTGVNNAGAVDSDNFNGENAHYPDTNFDELFTIASYDNDKSIATFAEAIAALHADGRRDGAGVTLKIGLRQGDKHNADHTAGHTASNTATQANNNMVATLLYLGDHQTNTGSHAADSDLFCILLQDYSNYFFTNLLMEKRHAEAANSQKNVFLARISHEIRTPLNAIIGFTEVMRDERFGNIGNARYREYINSIYSSSNYILSLINDLLDVTKIEAGKLKLEFTKIDVNQIIRHCLNLVQNEAITNRLKLNANLNQGLAPVFADERALIQIILNLLTNSLKFTPGGGTISVISEQEQNSQVVISIHDTGIGITGDNIDNLSGSVDSENNQWRIHTTIGSKGVGLGLPLVKSLVEANKGEMEISGKPGLGTLVKLRFKSGA